MPTHKPNSSVLNIMVDILFLIFTTSCFNLAVLASTLCVVLPRDLIFLGALVPEKYFYMLSIRIPLTLLQQYLIFIETTDIAIALALPSIYVCYITVLSTKELQLNRKYPYKTAYKLRKAAAIRHSFNSFQILHQSFISFLGPFIIYLQYVACFVPVLCFCVLILHWKSLQIISKLVLVVGWSITLGTWMVVLQMGKYLHIRGNKVFASWKRHDWETRQEQKIMSKYQKGCRLILIAYGKMLVVVKMTQFNYVKTLMILSCKALIAIRKMS